MPRIGSRIRTVAPAFPSQGPASLVLTLSGTVIQPQRFGRNPIVRARAVAAAASLADIPEPAMKPVIYPSAAPAAAVTSTKPDGCTDCG